MTANHPRSVDTRPRSRRVRRVLGIASALLVGMGLAVLAAGIVAPEMTERVAGTVKVAVQQATNDVTGTRPTITLGGSGGRHALDTAGRGEFVEMTGYRREGVPPVYAAHNVRGGDVILGWSPGQRVDVRDAATGTITQHVFVEERMTPRWGDSDQLVGMSGSIVLQTCLYGSSRMRFVSLVPSADLTSQDAAA
jgi:hypothetical protein